MAKSPKLSIKSALLGPISEHPALRSLNLNACIITNALP